MHRHEIIGGPHTRSLDGKVIHSPCREEGIWLVVSDNMVLMDSEGMVTKDTQFYKFAHVVKIVDGKEKHFYKEITWSDLVEQENSND